MLFGMGDINTTNSNSLFCGYYVQMAIINTSPDFYLQILTNPYEVRTTKISILQTREETYRMVR